MNVYDFDNTIYDGESIFDFYLFSVKKHPKLISYLFVVLRTFLRYKMCRITEEEMLAIGKKYIEEYLSELSDLDALVKEFWDRNAHKIKPFYEELRKEDDLIITASIGFLLQGLFSRIGIERYIASEIDVKTSELLQLCYRKNKVALFLEQYPDAEIERFYTDSANDRAMMDIAKEVYLVKGNRIEKIK